MAEAHAHVQEVAPPAKTRRRPLASERPPPGDWQIEGPLPDAILESPNLPRDPPLPDVPLPETKAHRKATRYAVGVFEERFPNAEVTAETDILFSEAGRRGKSRLRPDFLVALSVPRSKTLADFDVAKLGAPDFVMEVLSRTTWELDLGRKLDVYQKIGVRECLFFDPTGEDLAGNGKELWGYALTPNERRPLEEGVLPNGERCVRSAVLGMVAYVLERVPPARWGETWAVRMCWRDPETGEDKPDYSQSRAGEAQARAGEAQARAEAQAERAKAQAEKAKAEEERAAAQLERAKAQAAQRRIAELEEELRRRGRSS